MGTEHLPLVVMMLVKTRASMGRTTVDKGRTCPAWGSVVKTPFVLYRGKDLLFQLERRRGRGGASSTLNCDGGPVIYSTA